MGSIDGLKSSAQFENVGSADVVCEDGGVQSPTGVAHGGEGPEPGNLANASSGSLLLGTKADC